MSCSIRLFNRIHNSGFAHGFLLRSLDGVELDNANSRNTLIERAVFTTALRDIRAWCSTNVQQYRVQETGDTQYPICILLNREDDCVHVKIRFDDGRSEYVKV